MFAYLYYLLLHFLNYSGLDIQFIFSKYSIVLFLDDNRSDSFASLTFFDSIALQSKSLCMSLSLLFACFAW